MKRMYDEPLSKHTTFRIGGPAEVLSIPESEEELIREIKHVQGRDIDYKILGRGSNLLISDSGINGVVIKNTSACTNIEREGNLVSVGSSVSLQKFIKFCVNNNLEGKEYLFSVPATVGGAIYMNAGRGKKHNLSISDNLISVKIFDGTKVRRLKKEQCDFGFRQSVFHRHDDWIILEGEFELDDQPKEIGERKIKERKEKVKDWFIYKYPSAGSVFKRRSFLAKRLLNRIKIGDAKLEGNFICNLGTASFNDVLWLINLSKMLSYLTFKKPELEIEIWE